jgi:hypothetical protein
LRAPHSVARTSAALFALIAIGAAGARAETPVPVGLTLDGMHYVMAEGGAARLAVEAQRAEITPGAGRIALVGVRAQVASIPGAPASAGSLELVCERGQLDLATGEFLAEGGVAARTAGGRVLRTEQLRYAQARGLIHGAKPVALSDDSGEYRGGGFEYWVRNDRFRLTGGARVVQGE